MTTFVIDRLVVAHHCIELNQSGELGVARVAILRLEPSEPGRHQLVLDVVTNHEAINGEPRYQSTASSATSPHGESRLPTYVQPLQPHQTLDGRRPALATPIGWTFDGTHSNTARPAPPRRRLRPGLVAATATIAVLAALATLHQPEPSAQPPPTSAAGEQTDKPIDRTSIAEAHATDDAALRAGLAGVGANLPASQLTVDASAGSLAAPTTSDDPAEHPPVEGTPDPVQRPVGTDVMGASLPDSAPGAVACDLEGSPLWESSAGCSHRSSTVTP